MAGCCCCCCYYFSRSQYRPFYLWKVSKNNPTQTLYIFKMKPEEHSIIRIRKKNTTILYTCYYWTILWSNNGEWVYIVFEAINYLSIMKRNKLYFYRKIIYYIFIKIMTLRLVCIFLRLIISTLLLLLVLCY